MEDNCIFLIFGATGDLANRKILPALYQLEQEKYFKENFKIVLIARKEKTNEQYGQEVEVSIGKFSKRKVQDDVLKKLVSRIYYKQLEFSNFDDYVKLKELIERLVGEKNDNCERIFYLAVPPSFFGIIIENLKKAALARRGSMGKTYNRVIFEKPFGNDLSSARELNKAITKVFDEKQIYRIDHYMAKELVQNLIV